MILFYAFTLLYSLYDCQTVKQCWLRIFIYELLMRNMWPVLGYNTYRNLKIFMLISYYIISLTLNLYWLRASLSRLLIRKIWPVLASTVTTSLTSGSSMTKVRPFCLSRTKESVAFMSARGTSEFSNTWIWMKK